MKKTFNFFSIILFILTYAQKPHQVVNYYDFKKLQPNEVYTLVKVNGVNTLHGLYKKYDTQGYLNVECNYNYGKINGEYKINLSADDAYILSNNPKEYIKQYAGKISRIIQYSNGIINGNDTQYEYTNPNKKFIRTKTVYLKGIPISEESYFSENKPERICQNGNCKEYDFETGKIIRDYAYSKNIKIREGNYKEFLQSGIIKYNVNYKNNQKEGTFQTFDKNGNLITEETYKNGLQIGDTKYYYDNGIEKDGSKYNLLINEEKEFYENNEKFLLKYLGDKKYLKTIFYPNGNKKTITELRQINRNDFFKDGNEKSYYDDGNLLNSLTFVTFRYREELYERLQGPAKFYYKSGNIEVEGNYKNDVMVGIWNDFYENGIKRKELIFKNLENPLDNVDEKYCHYKEYYPNGNLKTLGVYSDFRNKIKLEDFINYDINGNILNNEKSDAKLYVINDIIFENEEIYFKLIEVEIEYDDDDNEKLVNVNNTIEIYKLGKQSNFKDCSENKNITYDNIIENKNDFISNKYPNFIQIQDNSIISITNPNCFN